MAYSEEETINKQLGIRYYEVPLFLIGTNCFKLTMNIDKYDDGHFTVEWKTSSLN